MSGDGNFSTLLYVLLGGGVVSMITATVAAIRKYRAGEIVDDDAVIARLDKDNENLRKQNDSLLQRYETERQLRWEREEELAVCRRTRADLQRRLARYEGVGDER